MVASFGIAAYIYGNFYGFFNFSQKKRAARLVSDSSMPLRHIGTIVIWEGNYNPDINSIGTGQVNHK